MLWSLLVGLTLLTLPYGFSLHSFSLFSILHIWSLYVFAAAAFSLLNSPGFWCRYRSLLQTSIMWCCALPTGPGLLFRVGCQSQRMNGATTVVTVSAGTGGWFLLLCLSFFATHSLAENIFPFPCFIRWSNVKCGCLKFDQRCDKNMTLATHQTSQTLMVCLMWIGNQVTSHYISD